MIQFLSLFPFWLILVSENRQETVLEKFLATEWWYKLIPISVLWKITSVMFVAVFYCLFIQKKRINNDFLIFVHGDDDGDSVFLIYSIIMHSNVKNVQIPILLRFKFKQLDKWRSRIFPKKSKKILKDFCKSCLIVQQWDHHDHLFENPICAHFWRKKNIVSSWIISLWPWLWLSIDKNVPILCDFHRKMQFWLHFVTINVKCGTDIPFNFNQHLRPGILLFFSSSPVPTISHFIFSLKID